MHFLVACLQAVVLCQVEKAKEDMLNQLYSSVRFRIFFFNYYYYEISSLHFQSRP